MAADLIAAYTAWSGRSEDLAELPRDELVSTGSTNGERAGLKPVLEEMVSTGSTNGERR